MNLFRTVSVAATWLLLAVAGVALARPFTVDDVFRMQSVSGARISPDGEWVVYQVSGVDVAGDKRGSSQLWLVSWDGATSLELTQGEHGASEPRWSPDGRRIAFLREGDGEHHDDQVWVLDRRGGEAARLTDLPGGVSGFEWSPDGKRLALLHAPKPPEPKKDAKGEQIPQPIVIDRYQFKNDRQGYVHAQVAPERIYLYEIESGRLAPLTLGEGYVVESQPAWSPDGRRIAFVGRRGPEGERTDNDDLFVADATPGAEPRRLTDFPGGDLGPPAWSPDGKSIAFLRGDEPRYWLYSQPKAAVVPAAGGEVRVLSTALDRDVDAPRFSADGRAVEVLVTDNRVVYPARIPVAGGAAQPLLKGSQVVRSYDTAHGRTVVIAGDDQHPNEVHALENGRLRPLSRHNAGWLREVDLLPGQDIDYVAADGQQVYGLLTLPPGHRAGTRVPTLLWIHGGPYAQDEHAFDSERQLFAANGYAVLQINYRGSNGRGTEFGRGIFADWGNRDVSDLLAGVDHVVGLGVADPDQLLVGGWSQGGILTDYIISRDHRFKAAMSGAGAGNQISLYGSDQYVFGYEQEFGTPWDNTELWLRISSAFFKAGQIRTPTLYMGGLDDFNVPIIGGEQMYQALKSRGIPTQLVIYPGEHHGIGRPSFVRDMLSRWLEWYAGHLARAK